MAEETDDVDAVKRAPLAIAGIGASAGGIKALQEFFAALPDKTGAAIVVVVHLAPDHDSNLAEIISSRTAMRVLQVETSAELQPDCVYVIPPNRQLLIADGHVSAVEFDEPRGQRAPIDHLFRSLAKHRGGFAIVLSGAGSDGALGVRAVKEAGGVVLVQDPNEAEFGSMPRAAVAAGDADFVMPVHDLAGQFVELLRIRDQLIERAEWEQSDELIGRILAHLRLRTGHDFSEYKRASLTRRLDRRMQVVKARGLDEYLEHLRQHPDEVAALFADLLISVTRFFRDTTAFEQLANLVVRPILQRKSRDETIRVWVPACATGEEAYSIAMVFLDEAARLEISTSIHVFATDLDTKALAVAREGRYPDAVAADLPAERLRRYFVHENDEYRIKRELRDVIVFAQHSVLKDPPFSRMDLISCRNLLIYLNREAQLKVISTLHYSLVPEGYLFLGSSEAADYPEGLFRTVDRPSRILQSIGRRAGEALQLPGLLGDSSRHAPQFATISGDRARIPDAPQQHRQVLIELGPPSVLVDEAHRILNLSERAGNYLLHPPGAPTLDITELVRPELASELRVMLNRVFQLGESAMSLPIAVQFNGHSHYVCLQVSAVQISGMTPRALVVFIEGGPAQMPVEPRGADGVNPDEARRLQQELIATRANLKLTRQQFESATENLRATNEELQSINEEYRSTAEELETSREELQSMNEELLTLNNELKLKLDAVSRARDDLENLIIATEVGTLFLDDQLRIKRFTPRIRELFNINNSDEGRQIGDLTNRLDNVDFEKDAVEVIQQKTVIRKNVSAANRWYLMQMRPYRTVDNKVEGVVATFVDATDPSGDLASSTGHKVRKPRGKGPKN